jgi:hypothetical protein
VYSSKRIPFIDGKGREWKEEENRREEKSIV